MQRGRPHAPAGGLARAASPAQLSGGQRQRVAMGRAIVRDPAVFLMDEPLSNLDAKLRVQVRAEIARLQRELGTTTIYVTHDQVEAMTMGDRVAVLREGPCSRSPRPRSSTPTPTTLFVAAFIGSPAMNLLEGRFELSGGGGRAASVRRVAVAVGAGVAAGGPAGAAGLRRRAGRGRHPARAHAGRHRTAATRRPLRAAHRLHAPRRAAGGAGSELLVHLRTDARPAVTDGDPHGRRPTSTPRPSTRSSARRRRAR